jgi:hypothetical protein
MSNTFSDTTGKSGLIQSIEMECGFNDGDISNDTFLMAMFTNKINSALDDAFAIALKSTGWNVDDLNHTHDPFITTNLVSGQRDYHFTTDEEGSLILGIWRVMVADSTGVFYQLKKADMQVDPPQTMIDGQNSTGTPTQYDLTGNGIFLDLIPNYSKTNGLKIFIDREPTYFVVGDTTKIAGIDGLCQDYLWLKPAYEYARAKGLQNVERLYRDMLSAEQDIYDRYGLKERDKPKRLQVKIENNQ